MERGRGGEGLGTRLTRNGWGPANCWDQMMVFCTFIILVELSSICWSMLASSWKWEVWAAWRAGRSSWWREIKGRR